MSPSQLAPRLGRRALLVGAAAALAPFAARASAVCTPRELARHYLSRVDQRLALPAHEARIYAHLAELELTSAPQPLRGPQYLLVVDSCPAIQAAFLFWRLAPGSFELIGASPASTADPWREGCIATPCGVFPQAQAEPGALAARVYDFGLHRSRAPGSRRFVPVRVQARAAQGRGAARLGLVQSDGPVLLPPSLVAFLDEYGVLDAQRSEARTPAGALLPFAGRYMVVLDSERGERPGWAA